MRPMLAVTLASLLLAGCALPRPVDASAYADGCPFSEAPPAADAVLFITLRLPDCRDPSAIRLTAFRGNHLFYGAASPDGTFRFYDKQKWDRLVHARIGAGTRPILYIHGYNNNHDDGIERAVAIAGLADPRRPVFALTWPSYAQPTKYYWDEANVDWTLHHARAVVRTLATQDRPLTIVAHSMGSRIAIDAIEHLLPSTPARAIEALVLAAPDFDRIGLRDRLIASPLGLPVTIYGSRRDQPLSASWRAHGYPRAGDFSRWVRGHEPDYQLTEIRDVTVVDLTDVTTGWLGHAGFIDTPQGAADLCRTLKGPVTVARLPIPGKAGNFLLSATNVDDDCARRGQSMAEWVARPNRWRLAR